MTAPLATPVPEGIGGIYGDDLYDHALVLIALTAAGEAILRRGAGAVARRPG